MTDCKFIDNTAAGNGGAVRNISNSAGQFTNCRFQGNAVGGTGGAVCQDASPNTTIIASTFCENTPNACSRTGDSQPRPSLRVFIPLIAIQMSALRINSQMALIFTKVHWCMFGTIRAKPPGQVSTREVFDRAKPSHAMRSCPPYNTEEADES